MSHLHESIEDKSRDAKSRYNLDACVVYDKPLTGENVLRLWHPSRKNKGKTFRQNENICYFIRFGKVDNGV